MQDNSDVGYETGIDSFDGGDGDGAVDCDAPGAEALPECQLGEPLNKIDLLVVIDNSGSMGGHQERMVPALQQLRQDLGAGQADGADLRMAFTTTDNGGCVGNTTPEGGRLQASSCLDRLDDFTFVGAQAIHATEACTARCLLDDSQLVFEATSTENDPEAKVRPWIEAGPDHNNLGAGVTIDEAIACMAPQGINGCGWEQPLEAAHQALSRSGTPGEIDYDFFREDAISVLLFVTDEADCSFANHGIFSEEWGKVFWEDPDGFQATSAVCWNAGVHCEGESGQMSCSSENYATDGSAGAADADAVMRPMSRYYEALEAWQAQLQARNERGKVIVSLLAGVADNGVPHYAETSDFVFTNTFGIGAGCEGVEGQSAVPPVRLYELAKAFPALDEPMARTICRDDLRPGMGTLAAQIREVGGF